MKSFKGCKINATWLLSRSESTLIVSCHYRVIHHIFCHVKSADFRTAADLSWLAVRAPLTVTGVRRLLVRRTSDYDNPISPVNVITLTQLPLRGRRRRNRQALAAAVISGTAAIGHTQRCDPRYCLPDQLSCRPPTTASQGQSQIATAEMWPANSTISDISLRLGSIETETVSSHRVFVINVIRYDRSGDRRCRRA